MYQCYVVLKPIAFLISLGHPNRNLASLITSNKTQKYFMSLFSATFYSKDVMRHTGCAYLLRIKNCVIMGWNVPEHGNECVRVNLVIDLLRFLLQRADL